MVLVGWDVIFFYICFQIKKKKKKKKNTFESLGSKFQIRGGGDLQKRQGLEGIFLEFYYLYIYIYIYINKGICSHVHEGSLSFYYYFFLLTV